MSATIACRTKEQLIVHEDKPACNCGCHLSVVDLTAEVYRRECYKCGELKAFELTPRVALQTKKAS